MSFIKNKLGLNDTSSLLILLWIFLPIVMSLCLVVEGLRGKLPTSEELVAMGLSLHYIVLTYNRETYQLLFHILGVISIVYVIYMLFSNKKSLFREKVFKQKKFLYFLFGLLIWSIICSALSDDLKYAFVGENYLCDGLSSYFIYAAVFTIAYSITDELDKIKLLRCFIGVVSFMSIVIIVQSMNLSDFLDYIFTTRESFVFFNTNHFAYVLCMCVCASLGLFLYDYTTDKMSIFYMASFILNYIALLVNDTFGCWIAVIVTMPIIYVLYCFSDKQKMLDNKMAIIIYIALIIISFLFSKTLRKDFLVLFSDVGNIVKNNNAANSAGSGRLILWKDTIQRIKERPIFGFGPEGFYGENEITGGNSTHNEYLQVAGFLGIPGLILYMTSIVLLLKYHITNLKKLSPAILIASGAFGCYLISAFFGVQVFNTFPYFMMFYGLASSY